MTDILVPDEQEGTKAVVRSWLKQVGDTVAINDPLVELETDKVTQEIPAPAAGILAEILLDTDAEAMPGMVLGRLDPLAEAAEAGPDESEPSGESASGLAIPGDVVWATAPDTALSPSVRRAVKEHDIDPSTIAGTGRGGRVTRADVDSAVLARGTVADVPVATERAPSPPPEVTQPVSSGGVRSVPHDRMRLAIAHNMLHSVTVAPHVTAVFECDFSAIAAHRRRHQGRLRTKRRQSDLYGLPRRRIGPGDAGFPGHQQSLAR